MNWDLMQLRLMTLIAILIFPLKDRRNYILNKILSENWILIAWKTRIIREFLKIKNQKHIKIIMIRSKLIILTRIIHFMLLILEQVMIMGPGLSIILNKYCHQVNKILFINNNHNPQYLKSQLVRPNKINSALIETVLEMGLPLLHREHHLIDICLINNQMSDKSR